MEQELQHALAKAGWVSFEELPWVSFEELAAQALSLKP
jgi:hypothetical protein